MATTLLLEESRLHFCSPRAGWLLLGAFAGPPVRRLGPSFSLPYSVGLRLLHAIPTWFCGGTGWERVKRGKGDPCRSFYSPGGSPWSSTDCGPSFSVKNETTVSSLNPEAKFPSPGNGVPVSLRRKVKSWRKKQLNRLIKKGKTFRCMSCPLGHLQPKQRPKWLL